MKTIKIAAVAVFALACGAFCFSKSAEMLSNPYLDREALANGTAANGGSGGERYKKLRYDDDVQWTCNAHHGGCTWERVRELNDNHNRNKQNGDEDDESGGSSTEVGASVSVGDFSAEFNYSHQTDK